MTNEGGLQSNRFMLHLKALAAVLLFALLVRVAGCFVPLFGDEATIVKNITQFARDRTILPFDVTYPTLYSYMGAVVLGGWSMLLLLVGKAHTLWGAALLLITDQAPLLLPLRLFTVALDLGVILAAYFLGKRLRDVWTGVTAALFVALSQNHLHYARWALPDVLMSLFCALCLLAALRLIEQPTMRWYLLAGALAGLAVTSKYNGGTAVVIVLSAHLLGRHEEGHPLRWRNLGKLAASAGVCVAVFFAGSPAWLLRPDFCVATFLDTTQHMAAGHNFVPGGASYLWIGSFLIQRETTLGVLGMLGVLWALVHRRRADWVPVVFICITVLIVGRWQKQSAYYLLGIWPALLVLGAAMLRDVAMKFQRPMAMMVVLVLPAALLPAARSVAFAREALRTDNRVLAERWMQLHIPAGTRIAVDWGAMPALYDFEWMREAGERHRKRIGDGTDIEIWERFARQTRAYRLIPIKYDPAWLWETDAQYAIASSFCSDRFLLGAPPVADQPFFEGFMVRRNFYRALLADKPGSPFLVVKRFDGGSGPEIVILEAVR